MRGKSRAIRRTRWRRRAANASASTPSRCDVCSSIRADGTATCAPLQLNDDLVVCPRLFPHLMHQRACQPPLSGSSSSSSSSCECHCTRIPHDLRIHRDLQIHPRLGLLISVNSHLFLCDSVRHHEHEWVPPGYTMKVCRSEGFAFPAVHDSFHDRLVHFRAGDFDILSRCFTLIPSRWK
ncbi:hypothetical protein L208DRAFT_610559 [Tricholoma matsutake]|nr:hypothetical protein L208DRAFT_610559 [Tricholoma matsutake 945]